MKFNYSQICANLLKNLPEKQKAIISRRFGLNSPTGEEKRETLEFIGKDYGVTRERVRQIEQDGFSKLQPLSQKEGEIQKVFQYFKNYLKNRDGLKKEEILLEELGGKNWKNQIYFLLTLGKDFNKFGESEDFYSFWTINKNSPNQAQKVIKSFLSLLKRKKRPLPLNIFNSSLALSQPALTSYLEISKEIQQNSEGFFGFKKWSEINPKGVKDKAYLVFKEEKRPLHFNQVTSFIGKSALPQTVHNELIKDTRFVLVGRGVYALREWGYEEGYVKDIIFKVLKESKKPLTKEEILKKVLKQRLVKKNTILLNLSNKKYFSKNTKGFYTLKTKIA